MPNENPERKPGLVAGAAAAVALPGAAALLAGTGAFVAVAWAELATIFAAGVAYLRRRACSCHGEPGEALR